MLDGAEKHSSRIKKTRRRPNRHQETRLTSTSRGKGFVPFVCFCSTMFVYYLVKVNNWFRMDADELQARSVALEELRKQPEKDGPHLLVLEWTHMCGDKLLRSHFVLSFVRQSGKATSTSREWRLPGDHKYLVCMGKPALTYQQLKIGGSSARWRECVVCYLQVGVQNLRKRERETLLARGRR